MANIEYWIQLENRPWDASPRNIDRLTGLDMKETTGKDPVDVELTVLSTGAKKTRKMFNPVRDLEGNVKDALILRRYKPPTKADQSDAWTVPDDRFDSFSCGVVTTLGVLEHLWSETDLPHCSSPNAALKE